MPKLLKDMGLDEISLVDEPASPGARVALFKRRNSGDENEAQTPILEVRKALGDSGVPDVALAAFEGAVSKAYSEVEAMTFDEARENAEALAEGAKASSKLTELVYLLAESIRSVYADAEVEDPASLVNESIEQFNEAVKNEIGGKSKAEKAMKTCADCKKPEVCKDKGACAMSEDKKDFQKSIDEAVTKAVGEAVAKAKADAEAEVKKAREEAAAAIAKANEEIAKINEAKAEEARLAKAKTLVEGVPGMEAETVAKALKGMDADTQAAFEKSLAAAREAAKLGKVTKELGGSGGAAPGSANERIAKAAAGLRAQDPKLTNAQAVAKALENDPALYSDYIAERA